MRQVLILLICPSPILFHECPIVAIQGINILIMIVGDLVVVSHHFVPWIEVVFLEGFGLIQFELYLNGDCGITDKCMSDWFLGQE